MLPGLDIATPILAQIDPASPLAAVPDWLWVAFAAILGLFFGSFLNVVIYRLPRRCLSIAKPRGSFCPSCKKPVRWFDNVPVASWLLLNGKCRDCRGKISMRYPFVEAVTGGLFAFIVWRMVVQPGDVDDAYAWLTAATHCGFAASMIACAFIDWDLTILPDQITIGGTLLLIVLALLNPYQGGVPAEPEPGRGMWTLRDSQPRADGIALPGTRVATPTTTATAFTRHARLREQAPIVDAFVEKDLATAALVPDYTDPARYESWDGRLRAFFSSMFGALISGGALWLLGLIMTLAFQKKAITHGGGSAMGLGDVKLLMVFGALLGWPGALLALLIGAVLGMIVGIPRMMITGKHGIPFGPFLAAAAIFVGVFYADILKLFYELYLAGLA